MASLSSLPPEIILIIVNLSVPSFAHETWNERRQGLRRMSLVKIPSPAARSTLHRNIVLRTQKDAEEFSRCRRLRKDAYRVDAVHCGVPYDETTSGGKVSSCEMDLEALLQTVQPTKVVLACILSVCWSDISVAKDLKSLFAHGVTFSHPTPRLFEDVLFPSLRRLSLEHVNVPRSDLIFTPSNFPQLSVLAFFNATSLGELVDGPSPRPAVDLSAIFPQLHAISSLERLASTAITAPIFDTWGDLQGLELIRSLPRSATVLRVVASRKQYRKNLSDILQALESSNVRELHLGKSEDPYSDVDDDDDDDDEDAGEHILDTALVGEWAKERGVKVVLEGDVELDMWDSPFWTFLDAAEQRMGLSG